MVTNASKQTPILNLHFMDLGTTFSRQSFFLNSALSCDEEALLVMNHRSGPEPCSIEKEASMFSFTYPSISCFCHLCLLNREPVAEGSQAEEDQADKGKRWDPSLSYYNIIARFISMGLTRKKGILWWWKWYVCGPLWLRPKAPEPTISWHSQSISSPEACSKLTWIRTACCFSETFTSLCILVRSRTRRKNEKRESSMT